MISKDTIDELDFPKTDAKPVNNYGQANGWIVEYIDQKGNPDSMFIPKRSWDAAREGFEEHVSNAVIVNYQLGKMSYDFD